MLTRAIHISNLRVARRNVASLQRQMPPHPAFPRQVKLQPQRCSFSLDAKAAASFLSQHLETKAQITQDASRSAAKGEVISPSLAILIHADRRPQRTADGQVWFGPSMLLCKSEDLPLKDPQGSLGQGDLGILKVQSQDPSLVVQHGLAAAASWSEAQARDLLRETLIKLGITASEQNLIEAATILLQMWKLFSECEGIWFTLQLNIGRTDQELSISNPFLEFDDYALQRLPPSLQERYKNRSRAPNTAEAEDGGLFYIKLNNGGKIGSFGYGAGNAMGTMDGLALAGGKPANFLDGGGGANKANARLAMETLHRDSDVRAIFVNTFGGITQTDIVAEGIIEAVRINNMKHPIVVRVKGTCSDEAKEKLRKSGLTNFFIEDDFREAARLAVVLSETADGEI